MYKYTVLFHLCPSIWVSGFFNSRIWYKCPDILEMGLEICFSPHGFSPFLQARIPWRLHPPSTYRGCKCLSTAGNGLVVVGWGSTQGLAQRQWILIQLIADACQLYSRQALSHPFIYFFVYLIWKNWRSFLFDCLFLISFVLLLWESVYLKHFQVALPG